MNYRRPLTTTSLLLTLAFTTLTACSFSKSSESASESSGAIFGIVSSPFKSSSDSSTDEREKFEADVADYTAEFVTSSSGTLDDFREHMSSLAEDHGVTDWENDHAAYIGIGRGLKKAKLPKPQTSAFTESLSGNDPIKKQLIEEGLKK